MKDRHGVEIKHGDKLILEGGAGLIEIEAVMAARVPWLDPPHDLVPMEAYAEKSFCRVTIIPADSAEDD
jgi:hypothetical protein